MEYPLDHDAYGFHMAKKQTRRSVSLNQRRFAQLKLVLAKINEDPSLLPKYVKDDVVDSLSMSALVERMTSDLAEKLGVDLPSADQAASICNANKKPRTVAPAPGAHFTF